MPDITVTVLQQKEITVGISKDRIPDWARWIAVDEDGEVWVYEHRPKRQLDFFYGGYGNNSRQVDTLDFDSVPNWRDTVQRLPRPDRSYYPVGTLVVADSRLMTGGTCHGFLAGRIAEIRQDEKEWVYRLKLVSEYNDILGQSAREEHLIIALDPDTGEPAEKERLNE